MLCATQMRRVMLRNTYITGAWEITPLTQTSKKSSLLIISLSFLLSYYRLSTTPIELFIIITYSINPIWNLHWWDKVDSITSRVASKTSILEPQEAAALRFMLPSSWMIQEPNVSQQRHLAQDQQDFFSSSALPATAFRRVNSCIKRQVPQP